MMADIPGVERSMMQRFADWLRDVATRMGLRGSALQDIQRVVEDFIAGTPMSEMAITEKQQAQLDKARKKGLLAPRREVAREAAPAEAAEAPPAEEAEAAPVEAAPAEPKFAAAVQKALEEAEPVKPLFAATPHKGTPETNAMMAEWEASFLAEDEAIEKMRGGELEIGQSMWLSDVDMSPIVANFDDEAQERMIGSMSSIGVDFNGKSFNGMVAVVRKTSIHKGRNEGRCISSFDMVLASEKGAWRQGNEKSA